MKAESINQQAEPHQGTLVADRVENLLREEVARRQFEPDAQLKHETEIASQFNVSRKTVRAAMQRLKKDGLVYAIRGKGTFVKPFQRTDVTLICSNTYHPYNMMAVGVLTSMLREQGYNAKLVTSQQLRNDWGQISQDASNGLGGIIVGLFAESDLCWLAEHAQMPFVLIGDSDSPIRKPAMYNQVIPDNYAQMFRATQYLLDQGHTRIGYLAWGSLDDMAYRKESYDGFQAALQSHGLALNPDWCMALPSVNFSEQQPDLTSQLTSQATFKHWFDSDNAPTALLMQSALELQIRDILEMCGRDRFSDDAVVTLMPYEQLQVSFGSMGKRIVVCSRFEMLAKRALAILQSLEKSTHPPVRETCDQSFVCIRQDGVWHIQ